MMMMAVMMMLVRMALIIMASEDDVSDSRREPSTVPLDSPIACSKYFLHISDLFGVFYPRYVFKIISHDDGHKGLLYSVDLLLN